MKKRTQILAMVAIAVILAGTLMVFFPNDHALDSKVDLATPGYIFYRGITSKIYLVSSKTAFSEANETFVTAEGQTIQKGSQIFIITATLRNDYTADVPAPPVTIPIAPADGTAYLYLTFQLYNKDKGAINATCIQTGDFSLPSFFGTGLVLASGQTSTVDFHLATSQTSIDSYDINLIFVGDSIPTSIFQT